ncbi:MAG TPA: hypothetical protein VK158_04750 [Acidobacteriota bacterium]|nr:hypothetical protein [Acidobacteriota bacterium]
MNPLDTLKYEKGNHLEALLKECITDNRAHAYIVNEKDKDHLFFSGYGTWKDRSLENQFIYGVMENTITKRTYHCRVQSPLSWPHMMDRIWGMDIEDLGAYQLMMDRLAQETNEFTQ